MEDVSATHELLTAQSESRRHARSALLKRYFLLSLLLSTWVPVIFFMLLAPSGTGGSGGLWGVKSIFLFLGTAHVPITLFFYTDKDFSGIIKAHKLRYVYLPLFLIVATGLLFALSGAVVQAFLLLAYWSWQAFHYGRQNIGVYAFASIAQTGASPHKAEKLAIDLGTLLGILGTFKILGMAVAPSYLHGTFNHLYQFGYVAFAGVFVFSLAVYLKFYRDTTAFKTIFFFTSVFFFYPVFISTDENIAFLSYAIAHGLQYIIFMTVISANVRRQDEPRAVAYRSVWKLVVLMLVVGFVFWRVSYLKQIEVVKGSLVYTGIADFLFGAVLGATMSHFVVDASAWKLSLKQQRSYITRRFKFVFDKGAAVKPGNSQAS
jgi:MFS family permease